MTPKRYISISTRRFVSSLLLLLMVSTASAQTKFFSIQKDSIPLMRGFAVSFDLVGFAMMQLSDHGQYEGALRLNLHDEWFPIVEAGIGRANHKEDEVTHISYKTSAPYFRIGIDRNLLKNKHGDNRLYAGIRYAFTKYKIDISREDFHDPVWDWPVSYGVKDLSCSFRWMEVVIGIDAKIFGPLHLGWSVRYKRRLASECGNIGKTWYVPGFGLHDDSQVDGTFNVIIDI